MEKQEHRLTPAEWLVMEPLWRAPCTMAQLLQEVCAQVGWSKSTVKTMIIRLEDKGYIRHTASGRAKTFYPMFTRDEAAVDQTNALLNKAYHGSIGQMIRTMLSQEIVLKEEIAQLYEILKKRKGRRIRNRNTFGGKMKMKQKNIIRILTAVMILTLLSGCAPQTPANTARVGILLPRDSDWEQIGSQAAEALKAEGIQTVLKYGSSDQELLRQTEKLAKSDCDYLIVSTGELEVDLTPAWYGDTIRYAWKEHRLPGVYYMELKTHEEDSAPVRQVKSLLDFGNPDSAYGEIEIYHGDPSDSSVGYGCYGVGISPWFYRIVHGQLGTKIFTPGKIGISVCGYPATTEGVSAAEIERQLDDLGYEVAIQYSSGRLEDQCACMESLILDGCRTLIVFAESTHLTDYLSEALEMAKNTDVTVIACNSPEDCIPGADYRVDFGNYTAGWTHGQYLEEALKLETAEGPFWVEIGGLPLLSEAHRKAFYDGVMDVLKPYFDSGKLRSTDIDPSSESGVLISPPYSIWSTTYASDQSDPVAAAYDTYSHQLLRYYPGTAPDAIILADSSIAPGIVKALNECDTGGKTPILTGHGWYETTYQLMQENDLALTTVENSQMMADVAVAIADDVMQGRTGENSNPLWWGHSVQCQPLVLTGNNPAALDACQAQWLEHYR